MTWNESEYIAPFACIRRAYHNASKAAGDRSNSREDKDAMRLHRIMSEADCAGYERLEQRLVTAGRDVPDWRRIADRQLVERWTNGERGDAARKRG